MKKLFRSLILLLCFFISINSVVALDTVAPTCKLNVATSGITFAEKKDNVGVTSFGLGTTLTPSFNNKSSLPLEEGTFYGYVKDDANNKGICGKIITNISLGFTCTKAPTQYYKCTKPSTQTYTCQKAPGSTPDNLACNTAARYNSPSTSCNSGSTYVSNTCSITGYNCGSGGTANSSGVCSYSSTTSADNVTCNTAARYNSPSTSCNTGSTYVSNTCTIASYNCASGGTANSSGVCSYSASSTADNVTCNTAARYNSPSTSCNTGSTYVSNTCTIASYNCASGGTANSSGVCSYSSTTSADNVTCNTAARYNSPSTSCNTGSTYVSNTCSRTYSCSGEGTANQSTGKCTYTATTDTKTVACSSSNYSNRTSDSACSTGYSNTGNTCTATPQYTYTCNSGDGDPDSNHKCTHIYDATPTQYRCSSTGTAVCMCHDTRGYTFAGPASSSEAECRINCINTESEFSPNLEYFRYECPDGSIREGSLCYDYVNTSTCSSGYSNPIPSAYTCDFATHTGPDSNNRCSYTYDATRTQTGTTYSGDITCKKTTCSSTSHTLSGTTCSYDATAAYSGTISCTKKTCSTGHTLSSDKTTCTYNGTPATYSGTINCTKPACSTGHTLSSDKTTCTYNGTPATYSGTINCTKKTCSTGHTLSSDKTTCTYSGTPSGYSGTINCTKPTCTDSAVLSGSTCTLTNQSSCPDSSWTSTANTPTCTNNATLSSDKSTCTLIDQTSCPSTAWTKTSTPKCTTGGSLTSDKTTCILTNQTSCPDSSWESTENLGECSGTKVSRYCVKTLYTITFDNQNAVTPGTQQIILQTGDPLEPITIPTKTNYLFGGYYTETNGNGTEWYNEVGTPKKPAYDLERDLILYALWLPNYNTIHYDCADGEGFMDDTIVAFGESAKLRKSTCEKPSSEFDKWEVYKKDENGNLVPYTDEEGNVIYFSDEYEVKKLFNSPGEEVTLVAKYTHIGHEYLIHYNANGGKGNMDDTVAEIDVKGNLRKNTYIREGYKFIGWKAYLKDVNDNFIEYLKNEKPLTFDDEAEYLNLYGEEYAEITLLAQWEAINPKTGRFESIPLILLGVGVLGGAGLYLYRKKRILIK